MQYLNMSYRKMRRSEIASFNARSKTSLYLLRTKGRSGFGWTLSGNFYTQIINFYKQIPIVLVSSEVHKGTHNINRLLPSGQFSEINAQKLSNIALFTHSFVRFFTCY